MRMEKRKFRIGELAELLAVEKFVIRFWEKEFNISSTRSHGGQRFYNADDANTFATIKDLLYNRGFTIAGARKELTTGKKKNSGAHMLEKFDEEAVVTHSLKTMPVQNVEETTIALQQIKHDLVALKKMIGTINIQNN